MALTFNDVNSIQFIYIVPDHNKVINQSMQQTRYHDSNQTQVRFMKPFTLQVHKQGARFKPSQVLNCKVVFTPNTNFSHDTISECNNANRRKFVLN